MQKFPTPNRSQIFETLQDQPDVEVLIVGAGINGIGTFRDLALQGVDVLMVDRADFCSGASAASSHMVHGGIRYLENGEFRLVKEAVEERNRLINNAPHLVNPLATTIPIFHWFSGMLNAPLKFLKLLNRPSERGAVVIKLGLMMYDAYTGDQGTVPKHTFQMKDAALKQFPKLNPNIICTATYYDAMMPSPERICMDLLWDTQRNLPQARALNYVSVGEADGERVALHDELTGAVHWVKPKLVINAAGPWIDFANERLGARTNFIGGTKGSHLVLEHAELREAIGDQEIFFENEDGRIVLIYPLHQRVMVGTSDIAIDNPDEAVCTEEEIDYFMGMIKRVFPTIEVDRTHIVFTFSGVRPLPASDANTTGQISRDHSIRVMEATAERPFPVYNLIGGKWTTFRAFAEQTTDKALAYLGLARKQSTANLPIGGGIHYPPDKDARWRWMHTQSRQIDLPFERIRILFERYGTRAAEIAQFMSEAEDAPLTHHPAYTRRELLYLAHQEQMVHLDDLLLRRTSIGMLGETSTELVEELAEVMGVAMGWNEAKKQIEIKRTKTIFAQKYLIQL